MLIRIRTDLAFKDKAKAEAFKAAVLPFLNQAVIINEAKANEERGFLEVENCGHDEGKPCETTARWEAGKGKVI